MSTIDILNVRFDRVTLAEAIQQVNGFLHSGKQHHLVTVNPEIVLKCQDNPEYRRIINSASLSVSDGAGIVWAGFINQLRIKKTRTRYINRIFILVGIFYRSVLFLFYYWFSRKGLEVALPERVTGTDLMLGICNKLSCRVFLLGAEEGVAEKVKIIFEGNKCKVKIVGTYSGNPRKESTGNIISLIKKLKPEILFVAFGAPAQEIWIHEHIKKMASVKVAIGVGGSFDTISGKIPRASLLFQKIGLEWAWRFYKEPRRYKRIFNALIVFPLKVIHSIVYFK